MDVGEAAAFQGEAEFFQAGEVFVPGYLIGGADGGFSGIEADGHFADAVVFFLVVDEGLGVGLGGFAGGCQLFAWPLCGPT